MKRIHFLLFFFISCNFVYAQTAFNKNSFILKGEIKENTSEFMFISFLDKNENSVIDSCKISNGKFLFTGFINGATLASIYQKDDAFRGKRNNIITFYLDPNKIKIWINRKGYKLKGAHTQNEEDNRLLSQNIISESLDIVINEQDSINTLIKNGDKSTALISELKMLKKKRADFKVQEKNMDYSFMSVNPRSYLNPQILSYYVGSGEISLDSAEIMFYQFDKLVQTSTRGKMLMREIDGKKNSSTGKLAPLFVKKDINGNEINLSSYRNNSYVLLDFWASWCVPCRKFTPTMQSFYKKYQSKGLEIISISWDSDEKAWKDAIKEDDMYKWKNVLANMYLPKDNSMRDKYAISSIPMLILIDKDGIIIGRYMAPNENGGEDELAQKFAEIFD